MKAKNIIIYILAVLALAQTAFTEEYLVKLPQNSEHYVIDDNVNVRAEPSLNGKKLFKLNTGDKVVILSKSLADYNYYRMEAAEWEKAKVEAEHEPFLLTEGLWAPWYKIKSDKGEGYISGRYVSCMELELDTNGDGKSEVLACLTTASKKGTLQKNAGRYDWEYLELSLGNTHKNYVLIKDKKASPIDFSLGKAFKKGCTDFMLLDTSSFSPPLCVVKIESAERNNGGSAGVEDYFYYSLGKFVYLFSNEFQSEDYGSDVYAEKNKIIVDFKRWFSYFPYPEDRDIVNFELSEHTQTVYTWNGKDFSSQTKELEIEYSKE